MTGASVLAVSADQVSAGPLGLLIVLLLFVTTILLIRNMNGRLKRLPPEFPAGAREPLDPDTREPLEPGDPRADVLDPGDPRAGPPPPRSAPEA